MQTPKPIFNNGHNGKAVAGLNKSLLEIVLALSTVGSTICVAFFIYSMMGHRSWIFDNIVAYVAYGVVAFGVCFLADRGVKTYGIAFFTELGAAWTRQFDSFGVLRMMSAFFKFSLLVFCFMFSYFTSKDGAEIVATMAKKTDASAQNTPARANTSEMRESHLKSYKNDIADIEKRKEGKLKTSLSEYQYKQYKKGTILDIAKPTIATVEKEFAKDLNLAKTALQNAQASFDSKENAGAALIAQGLEQNKKDNQITFETIKSVLNLIGVYPLWAALALIGMLAIDELVKATAKLPKVQPKQNEPSGGSGFFGGRSNKQPTEEEEERNF